MAKKDAKPKAGNEVLYAQLILYPKRKFALLCVFLFYVLLFAMLLQKEIPAGTPWPALAAPIILAGCLWIFFPATEEWQYRPWQNTKQKRERTLFD